jgi:hypothetical protein
MSYLEVSTSAKQFWTTRAVLLSLVQEYHWVLGWVTVKPLGLETVSVSWSNAASEILKPLPY